MRIMPVFLLLLLIFSMNVYAVEPIDEQQVMLYYSIPFGADKSQDSKHQFGLRLDQVTHDPRQDVPLGALAVKPAAMDFSMGYEGIKSFRIHGVDYASYLVAKAAEGEKAPVKPKSADGASTGASAGTGGKEEKPAETTSTAPKEEQGPITQAISELPVGVFLGVMVGVLIVSGVGG